MKQKLLVSTIFAVVALPMAANAGKHGHHGGHQLPWPVDEAGFTEHSEAKVELGKMLFWDKILSGNQNISCATCHHTLAGSGDGLALPIGEGGVGLGIARSNGQGADAIEERVPRNAPMVYNEGHADFTVMFHDGRLSADPSHPSGFQNPAGTDLPPGLDSALAAQAMFPVTSNAEMAGGATENPQGAAGASGNLAGPGGVWEQLALRLQAVPEYVALFQAAYPDDVNVAGDITYVMAANAIGAYEDTAFRADNSPFDRYLRGDRSALSRSQKKGMKLFYGKAGCASCHSGPFQTDLEFHAIAMPQVGPGKGHGLSGTEDLGRGPISGDPADDFRFRTPPLRNVALTGPWGHDGAYNSLRAVVEHHLDPVAGLYAYADDVANGEAQAVLPEAGAAGDHDFHVMEDPALVAAIASANELQPVRLRDREIDQLMDFLHALTDPRSLDLRNQVPWQGVPSGLPLAD